MKATERIIKRTNMGKAFVKKDKGYYFHSDEYFRGDWDCGKVKVIASKTISSPGKKFEI